MRLAFSRWALVCAALSTTGVACVYSSDAPIPNSSGQTSTTQDGTEPAPSGSDDAGGGTADAGSSSQGKDSGSSQATDSGATNEDSGGGPSAPTWTDVYTAYFAASSLGRCGSSGCHVSSRGGFKCGSDKGTCYQGLVNAGLVDATNGAQSAIADKSQTPLSWYGNGGNMPGGGANAKAAADITAWVNAGAQNN
jgi:hypothetical protein